MSIRAPQQANTEAPTGFLWILKAAGTNSIPATFRLLLEGLLPSLRSLLNPEHESCLEVAQGPSTPPSLRTGRRVFQEKIPRTDPHPHPHLHPHHQHQHEHGHHAPILILLLQLKGKRARHLWKQLDRNAVPSSCGNFANTHAFWGSWYYVVYSPSCKVHVVLKYSPDSSTLHS